MTRKKLFKLVLFALLIPSVLVSTQGYKVGRVIDGDTIELENGEKVRYIGIDTPETKHPNKPVEAYGKEAYEYNRSLVEGKTVRLEFDAQERDRYGRFLAYVYVGDLFVNAELVKAGYAQVSTYPPNVKYQDLFLELQKEAREAKRGLWANETSTTTSTKADPNDTVYVTSTGTKYHRDGCRHLSKSKIPWPLKDAVQFYKPCKACSPPVLESSKSTKAVSSSGRCQAITKKGTQCKRKAKAGSKYCWQHGG